MARAGLFGLVVAVTWWIWASAASADERPDVADSGTDADTDLRDGTVTSVAAPAADATAATAAAAPAPQPATDAPRSLLASVGKVVDGVVTPVVAPVVADVVAPVLRPVLAPVDGLVAPVLEPIVRPLGSTVHGMVGPILAPVVDPVVAAVAPVHGPAVEGLVGPLTPFGDDAEGTARALAASSAPASVPVLVPGPTLVDPALAPATPRSGEVAARRVASTRSVGTSGATSSADTAAATGEAAAPAAPATPALPVPRHSSRLPWSTGPAAPASAGGRDLPDRAHNAVAHATVHAHTATPALHAPVTPRVVGASVNSGSRPSVTPD